MITSSVVNITSDYFLWDFAASQPGFQYTGRRRPFPGSGGCRPMAIVSCDYFGDREMLPQIGKCISEEKTYFDPPLTPNNAFYLSMYDWSMFMFRGCSQVTICI